MPMQVCAGRPRCGALVERGYCEACKAAGAGKDARPSAAKRGYDGPWAKYSRARLERYPTCEGLRLEPDGPVMVNTHAGRRAEATATDHIVPHRGDKRLFWDPRNHQSACDECHGVKTAKHDGGFGNARSA